MGRLKNNMHYKFKSLNCNSCAAPLIKKMDSNICKCIYCRNTNLILENGKTKIIEDLIETKPIPEKKYSKLLYVLVIVVSILLPLHFLVLLRRSKNKEKKYTNGGLIAKSI